MDSMFGGDFSKMMQTAAQMKGEELKKDRKLFDTFPSYYQNSFFHKEEVTDLRKLPFTERLAAAEALKEAANDAFNKGDMMNSQFKYEEALSVFKYLICLNPDWRNGGVKDKDLEVCDYEGETPEEVKAIARFKGVCYRNIAAVQLNIANPVAWQLCIRACDDAIALNQHDHKALYRRGLARVRNPQTGTLESDLALNDLKAAYQLDSDNAKIKKEYLKLKKELSEQSARDKKTFTGMFGRGQVYEKEQKAAAKAKDGKTTTSSAENAQARIDEARAYAKMMEAKGNTAEAKKTYDAIAEVEAKMEESKKKHRKEMLTNPTPEMIADMKAQGIDWNDPAVRREMQRLVDGDVPEQTGEIDWDNPPEHIVEELKEQGYDIRDPEVAKLMKEAAKAAQASDEEGTAKALNDVAKMHTDTQQSKFTQYALAAVVLYGIYHISMMLWRMYGMMSSLGQAVQAESEPATETPEEPMWDDL